MPCRKEIHEKKARASPSQETATNTQRDDDFSSSLPRVTHSPGPRVLASQKAATNLDLNIFFLLLCFITLNVTFVYHRGSEGLHRLWRHQIKKSLINMKRQLDIEAFESKSRAVSLIRSPHCLSARGLSAKKASSRSAFSTLQDGISLPSRWIQMEVQRQGERK